MENKDAIELIKKVVSFIEGNELTNTSLDDLSEKLPKSPLIDSFNKNIFNSDKYPKLEITFSKEEIEKLKNIKNISKVLTDIIRTSNDLHLKLLYSIAWKQNNLSKLDSIISGITDKPNDSKTGAVFNAFGKHLRDRSNPIIDQHVIRAFLVIEKIEKYHEENFSDIRKREDFNKKKFEIDGINPIQRYTNWLLKTFTKNAKIINKDGKSRENFFYYADQILFTLGKTIKSK